MEVRENVEQNFKTCSEACSYTRSAKNLKYFFFRRIANPVCGVANHRCIQDIPARSDAAGQHTYLRNDDGCRVRARL